MIARTIALATLLALLAVGCASGDAGRPGEVASGSTDVPWRTAALVDVRSGETFTVDGLAGKLVVVEPMAIWCTTCAAQQAEVADALDRLASPDIVFVSLDVDPNERAADLAGYADRSGFGWSFAVASRDVARSLAQEFGDQVLSPPSTPIIIVAPSGQVVDQHFGIRRSGELVEAFRAHLP